MQPMVRLVLSSIALCALVLRANAFTSATEIVCEAANDGSVLTVDCPNGMGIEKVLVSDYFNRGTRFPTTCEADNSNRNDTDVRDFDNLLVYPETYDCHVNCQAETSCIDRHNCSITVNSTNCEGALDRSKKYGSIDANCVSRLPNGSQTPRNRLVLKVQCARAAKYYQYDETAPVVSGAWVHDGPASNDIDYQSSMRSLALSFGGAVDFESGIWRAEWAVGTTSGATNVMSWTAASLSSSTVNGHQVYNGSASKNDFTPCFSTVTNEDATTYGQPNCTQSEGVLIPGGTYFVTVRLWNGNNLTSTITSNGVTINSNLTSAGTVIKSGDAMQKMGSAAEYFVTVRDDSVEGKVYFIGNNKRQNLTLTRGETYYFRISPNESDVDSIGIYQYPFYLTTDSSGGKYPSDFSEASKRNMPFRDELPTAMGIEYIGAHRETKYPHTLIFTPSQSVPDTIYYASGNHAGRGGTLTIRNAWDA